MRRERHGHSWQPTLLVNELYLQLVRIKALQPNDAERRDDKASFFALAGQIMKGLLIHHARPLSARAEKIALWEDLSTQPDTSLAKVDHLRDRLEAIKSAVPRVLGLPFGSSAPL